MLSDGKDQDGQFTLIIEGLDDYGDEFSVKNAINKKVFFFPKKKNNYLSRSKCLRFGLIICDVFLPS